MVAKKEEEEKNERGHEHGRCLEDKCLWGGYAQGRQGKNNANAELHHPEPSASTQGGLVLFLVL